MGNLLRGDDFTKSSEFFVFRRDGIKKKLLGFMKNLRAFCKNLWAFYQKSGAFCLKPGMVMYYI
jgi:hypothetical protein